jgi:hypothetical protein
MAKKEYYESDDVEMESFELAHDGQMPFIT